MLTQVSTKGHEVLVQKGDPSPSAGSPPCGCPWRRVKRFPLPSGGPPSWYDSGRSSQYWLQPGPAWSTRFTALHQLRGPSGGRWMPQASQNSLSLLFPQQSLSSVFWPLPAGDGSLRSCTASYTEFTASPVTEPGSSWMWTFVGWINVNPLLFQNTVFLMYFPSPLNAPPTVHEKARQSPVYRGLLIFRFSPISRWKSRITECIFLLWVESWGAWVSSQLLNSWWDEMPAAGGMELSALCQTPLSKASATILRACLMQRSVWWGAASSQPDFRWIQTQSNLCRRCEINVMAQFSREKGGLNKPRTIAYFYSSLCPCTKTSSCQENCPEYQWVRTSHPGGGTG